MRLPGAGRGTRADTPAVSSSYLRTARRLRLAEAHGWRYACATLCAAALIISQLLQPPGADRSNAAQDSKPAVPRDDIGTSRDVELPPPRQAMNIQQPDADLPVSEILTNEERPWADSQRAVAPRTSQPEPVADDRRVERGSSSMLRVPPDCTRRHGDSDGLVSVVSQWCVHLWLQTSSDRTFWKLDACRDALGAPWGRLTWASSREIEVHIRDTTGRIVWRYDEPETASPHAEQVLATHCVSWSDIGALRDEQGRPLPSGTYTLGARVIAEELSGALVEQRFSTPPQS